MKYVFVVFASFYFLAQVVSAQTVAQWRGVNRDGHYPDLNLLKQWPEKGPSMLWSFEGLGAGHSSPVISNGRVYVTGIPDTLTAMGKLFVFDLTGKLLWTNEYGREFTENFQGTRSTPTIVGDLIYIESGSGAVYCLKTENGEKVWSVDFFEDMHCDSVQFGFSESVLIDGDRLICTPGGKTNNMVALNRFTGQKIWASKGFGEPATYSSPIVFDHYGHRLVVNLTASSIIGLDASSGEMLWRVNQFQDNKIHANTPIYFDGKVLISSASRKDSSGLVLLELSPDGRQADIVWRNKEVINLMSGAILKDGYIYVSAHIQPKWYCIDWNTGQERYMSKDFGGGPVIAADGLLYCYGEKAGEMALVEATPESFKIISKFQIPMGTAEHWAHPVIENGKLFVRHGNALMVYGIEAGGVAK